MVKAQLGRGSVQCTDKGSDNVSDGVKVYVINLWKMAGTCTGIVKALSMYTESDEVE